MLGTGAARIAVVAVEDHFVDGSSRDGVVAIAAFTVKDVVFGGGPGVVDEAAEQ